MYWWSQVRRTACIPLKQAVGWATMPGGDMAAWGVSWGVEVGPHESALVGGASVDCAMLGI
jgi:hypothetical protein